MPLTLKRVSQQPILAPRPDVPWEQDAVFNTAAAFYNGKFHLFYRGTYHPGWVRGKGGTYDSSVGHAISGDGIHFERLDEPVLKPGSVWDTGPTVPEDPRITRIGDTWYLVFALWEKYTTARLYPGYAVSKDLMTWEEKGPLVRFSECGFNKNAALFPEKIGGRFWTLHRPESQAHKDLPERDFDWIYWTRNKAMAQGETPGVTVSSSSDFVKWENHKVIMTTREGLWDCAKVGPGAPPIRIPEGWLIVYHGVDHDSVYRLGIALLDADDPTKVLKRQEAPILEPELDWELNGDVPNVVFTCGALLFDRELWVYYGGADTVIGLAKGNIDDFLI